MANALRAKFPNGRPRCLGLGKLPGIHVAIRSDERLFYPSSGLTAPTNHLFVFYAARSSDPVPDLVADLAGRGILRKATVQATVNAETSGIGPQTVSSDGIYSHPTWYAHRTGGFPVDIYQVRANDEEFGYVVQTPAPFQPWAPIAGFPSRLYDGPLPPPDQHYAIPTVDPYAISIVTSACLKETPDHVAGIRIRDAADGGQLMEADVAFAQRPPAWMSTAAFRRAAIGPDVQSTDKPRFATVILTMADGKLAYAGDKVRW